MGVLSDRQLIELGETGKIAPFSPEQVKQIGDNRLVSYGVSSYGYDARLADDFKVFADTHCAVMDPKRPDHRAFVPCRSNGEYLTIPPHGYVLAHTVEFFDIPRDVIVICLGKSTYARTGLLVNVTPLEPSWRGQVTLELANLLPIPTRVYVNEGICQFIFLRGEEPPETSYADKGGKYQDQRGVTLAKL